MLSDLFAWIRQVIYLLIFLTLLLQILPDGSYRKYVKFFAGLIFVVTLLGPVVSLLAGQDWEEEILRTVTESWPEYREDGRAPDFDRISETGAEIYERHAAEMAEDLADE